MAQQHNKFEYRDLGKGSFFVEAPVKAHKTANFQQDNIISQVVKEHLKDEFAESVHTEAASMSDIVTHKLAPDNVPDMDLSEIKTYSFSEDGQSLGDVSQSLAKQEVPKPSDIDVASIKEESYQQGYQAAKAELEHALNEKSSDEALYNALQEKLAAIEPKDDIQNEAFDLSSGLIAILAKKLHLAVPADFEAIILGEMLPVLNKYYKKGKVIAKLHPDRVDYCNNLFRIGELPKELADNIEIVPDESVPKNDCSIEWQDAALEYSQEDLLTEAETIIDHLKVKIEN